MAATQSFSQNSESDQFFHGAGGGYNTTGNIDQILQQQQQMLLTQESNFFQLSSKVEQLVEMNRYVSFIILISVMTSSLTLW